MVDRWLRSIDFSNAPNDKQNVPGWYRKKASLAAVHGEAFRSCAELDFRGQVKLMHEQRSLRWSRVRLRVRAVGVARGEAGIERSEMAPAPAGAGGQRRRALAMATSRPLSPEGLRNAGGKVHRRSSIHGCRWRVTGRRDVAPPAWARAPACAPTPSSTFSRTWLPLRRARRVAKPATSRFVGAAVPKK
jgi:hypothetical protein